MRLDYGFGKDPAVVKNYMKGGALFAEEEGIWVEWESREELVRAALPPCLDYVNPNVAVYVIRIGGGNVGPAFMEAAIMLTGSFQGKVGMYVPSMLLYGPGAEPALSMGREIYGISKKYADDIRVSRIGDQAFATVVRGGRVVFDGEFRLNTEYNDPEAGMAFFGMPKAGDSNDGSAFFFTYDAHQGEDRDIVFDAVHLNDTVSTTRYTQDWIPGAVERIDMEESANDPWSSLEVGRFIGCGYAHQELHMIEQIRHRNVGDPVANMAKLMTGKFDLAAFGGATRFLNAEF